MPMPTFKSNVLFSSEPYCDGSHLTQAPLGHRLATLWVLIPELIPMTNICSKNMPSHSLQQELFLGISSAV